MFKANTLKKSFSERSFRGYVAVDDIQFKQLEDTEETCKGFLDLQVSFAATLLWLLFFKFVGHCTFEAGFCGWINQDENDDFDWKLGRGFVKLLFLFFNKLIYKMFRLPKYFYWTSKRFFEFWK